MGKTDKKWLFSIRNGAEIRPLGKGRKCPVCTLHTQGRDIVEGCWQILGL